MALLVPAVEEMLTVGKKLIADLEPEAPTKFGFHYPPFTSVRPSILGICVA
jgi:hypothetical protein